MRLVWTLLLLSGSALAREQLGQLKVDNLVVRPQFHLIEPAKADFQIGESLFSVRWEMDTRIAAVFTVGAKTLLGTSIHYASSVSEDLGFIEGYGEYTSDYGVFRAGLQPVMLGNEGAVGEADLDMPRSLLYQRRLAPLRDIGFSYAVDFNGYFTRLMVHNGESGSNTDGRPWLTARWGWSKPGRWRIGFAGQTGSTKPSSTSASGDTLAGVDPLKDAQWRLGGPFLVWTPHHWRIGLEGYLGEVIQDKRVQKYSVGYLNVAYTGETYFWGMRFDQFDPSLKRDTDVERQISMAFGMVSERRTSRIFLVLTKAYEIGHQIPNDEVRLIWHLTPQLPSAVPEL